jgi:hypothetical protein
MRNLILLLLATFITPFLYAQNDSTISFIAYWNKGDTKNYRITKKQILTQNNEEIKNQNTIYNIKCTVTDSTSDSYTIEWQYENTILSNIEISEEFNSVIEKYKIIKIIYTTDESGSFKEIVNWKEIRDLMIALFDKLPEMASDKSKDFSKVLKRFKEIYSSKEGISSLILAEVQVFHYPMGLEFNIKDTLSYEELLPNILGGDQIKGNGKLYFQTIDRENNLCTFLNKLELDTTDSKKVVVDFMNSILANKKYNSKAEKEKEIQELNAEFSKMSIDVTDNYTFTYRYYPGWPVNIHTKRTSKITSKDKVGYSIDEIIIEEL